MSSSYHIAGTVSVVFFMLCLLGICAQISTIWRRKREALDWHRSVSEAVEIDTLPDIDLPVRPTSVLSLNQFFASFLAFYSFLVYGICIEPFNHYLVWTRLLATTLVMIILYEIWHDRRQLISALGLAASLILMTAAIGVLIANNRIADEGRWIATTLAMLATVVFAQGLIHQIVRIRRTGRTGAVSLRMHQLTTLKDLSTIGFALTMPDGAGWPLIVVGGTGGAIKTVLMWHFRWVKRNPLAEIRRNDH